MAIQQDRVSFKSMTFLCGGRKGGSVVKYLEWSGNYITRRRLKVLGGIARKPERVSHKLCPLRKQDGAPPARGNGPSATHGPGVRVNWLPGKITSLPRDTHYLRSFLQSTGGSRFAEKYVLPLPKGSSDNSFFKVYRKVSPRVPVPCMPHKNGYLWPPRSWLQ